MLNTSATLLSAVYETECSVGETTCFTTCSSGFTLTSDLTSGEKCSAACHLAHDSCRYESPQPTKILSPFGLTIGSFETSRPLRLSAIARIDADVLNRLVPVFVKDFLPGLLDYIKTQLAINPLNFFRGFGTCLCLPATPVSPPICIGAGGSIDLTASDISLDLGATPRVTIYATNGNVPHVTAEVAGLRATIGRIDGLLTACLLVDLTCPVSFSAVVTIAAIGVGMEVQPVNATFIALKAINAIIPSIRVTLEIILPRPLTACGIALLPILHTCRPALQYIAGRVATSMRQTIGNAIKDAINKCASTTRQTSS